jgi:hypothetical protein
MNKRSNLLLYLLLNIIVSAATTLVVLWVWDHYRKPTDLTPPQAAAASTAAPSGENSTAALATATIALPPETPEPTETLPPPSGDPVIQILSVVGAGDIEQEVVMLKRVGEGNLRLVGWKLVGEHNNVYTFPEQPELTLYKDGAIQLYTGAGTDSVTEVYWNRPAAAWRSGEMIRLLDPDGAERATYRVP